MAFIRPTVSAGGVTIRMSLDTSIFRQLEHMEDQIPFAMALALNRTGKAAGKYLRDTLGDFFTVRNKWTQGGIGIPKDSAKWATKERLSVEVGAAQDYMRAQAVGDKRPAGKTPLGAVPSAEMRAAGPGGKLSNRAFWPGSLIQAGLAFRPGIDGHANGKRKPKLQAGQMVLASDKFGGFERGDLLYVIRRDADTQLEARWPMEDLVRDAMAGHWEAEAMKAIRFAIRTARRR